MRRTFWKIPFVIVLGCFMALTFNLMAGVKNADVVGGSIDKEVKFKPDESPFTVQATAVNGWKMKTADRSSSSGWSAAEKSEKSSSTTLLAIEPGKQFTVTLYGDLTPPPGPGGPGPVNYKVTGTLDEFSVVPSDKVIALGDTATFTSKEGTEEVSSTWSISPQGQMSDISGVSSVTIGTGQTWDPPPGEYTITAKKGGTSPQASATLVVAQLIDIYGVLSGWFNCFAGFNHFYAGDLEASDTELKLSLKYLPESLTYSMLHADWTLEGTPGGGQLTYAKNEGEPKWKGKTPLTEESFGTVSYKAKWDSVEVNKSFTKFKINVVQLGGNTDGTLYAFQTKGYSKSLKFVASILPSGVEEQFPNVKFEWTVIQGGDKVKLVYDKGDEKHKNCTVEPRGYRQDQVSAAEKDILVKVSWKCPSGSPNPYHTASVDGNFTVRTCWGIKLVKYKDLLYTDSAKYWHLVYALVDNLGKRLPADKIYGLLVKEKWTKYLLPGRIPQIKAQNITDDNEFPEEKGVYWDKIGAPIFPAMRTTGTQVITVDHLEGNNIVTIDAALPDGTITSNFTKTSK